MKNRNIQPASQPNTSTFSEPLPTHPQDIRTEITAEHSTQPQNGLKSRDVRLSALHSEQPADISAQHMTR